MLCEMYISFIVYTSRLVKMIDNLNSINAINNKKGLLLFKFTLQFIIIPCIYLNEIDMYHYKFFHVNLH